MSGLFYQCLYICIFISLSRVKLKRNENFSRKVVEFKQNIFFFVICKDMVSVIEDYNLKM